ncbi:Tetratricopeptide repeat protein 33 [Liparis tanakae]|uniref:Tetratricopeptide repeat protein 33 n=1 Tax=Liparis tanakae TaxID=230148 RepID=A0A4Z2GKJ0_9TELE|nr:Tetratricopeptide repeat protein 33 [Liparis tanakae]
MSAAPRPLGRVLTLLQEVFPAVKAAEMAVKFRPLWWEGWQTLGRAQLNLGEVDLAVRSFQVAIRLRPAERALWQEDLQWARRLQRQHAASREKSRQEEAAREQILDAPELRRDYDFESDEVLAACVAVAERQARYDELRRTAVVMDADGNVRSVLAEEPAAPAQEQFLTASGRHDRLQGPLHEFQLVAGGGGLPAPATLASADPASAALSAPSHGYNRVWELLAISLGSFDTSDGKSRDTTEDERRASAQRKRRPPPPPPRPRAPISQNRHLIFSISFRTTVLLSRM